MPYWRASGRDRVGADTERLIESAMYRQEVDREEAVEAHLLRVAVVRSSDGEIDQAMSGRLGGADVRAIGRFTIDGEPGGLLVFAHLPFSPRAIESALELPEASLRALEASLETFTSLITVETGAGATISSPMPCVGIAGDEAAIAALEGVNVRIPGRGMSQLRVHWQRGLLAPEHVRALDDRLDGVRLLAEAVNQTTPLGRYSQLLRVFERAFRAGPGALADPLIRFLAGGAGDYSREEVEAWTGIRGPAVHADRRDEFALSRDVRELTSRMEDAAYDVLLNKATWRSTDSSRREQWHPKGHTTSDGVALTQGMERASMSVTLLDDFGAFPLLLAGGEQIMSMLPRASWLRTDDESSNTLQAGGTWTPEEPDSSDGPRDRTSA